MASRSPMAVTPLPKSSAPETPLLGETTTAPQTVPFPSPQTFDIIPPLHGLLLRLLSSQTSTRTAGDTTGAVASSDPSAPQPQQQQPSIVVGNGPPPLNPKDLPVEASAIKIRIQKAHAVVETLPDVHRSVAEQEQEIEELEDRIARLRSVISDFGRRAKLNGQDP